MRNSRPCTALEPAPLKVGGACCRVSMRAGLMRKHGVWGHLSHARSAPCKSEHRILYWDFSSHLKAKLPKSQEMHCSLPSYSLSSL